LKPLFLPFPGTPSTVAAGLAKACGGEIASLNHRRFPDGESYFRLDVPTAGRRAVLVCALNDPDAKTTLLRLVASALRDQGAASIGLAAPYLAYMRQDMAFHPGEPVSARLYARMLSGAVDWLATVDPHLHRIHNLAEVYDIPTAVAHATEPMARWIAARASNPVLVGPDRESRQWTAAVAEAARAPYVVLNKERLGDRDVRVRSGDLSACAGRNAILIDDVVSSGRTVIEAARCLRERGVPVEQCVAVHGLASADTLQTLRAEGLSLFASDSTDTPAAAFSVVPELADAIRQFLPSD
jgi:ribose-phosphate pyrophosphokinase